MSRHSANHELALPREMATGLGTASLPPGSSEPQGAGAAVLIGAIRRHWLMALLVWIVGSAIAVPVIWKYKIPLYTATAQVKVDPILSTPLDRQMTIIPLFDSYLSSQAVLMSSQPVLKDALQDPAVQDLPLLKEPQPVSVLRENLVIAPVPRTQIIQIQVTDAEERSAIALADAVLNAYLDRYGGVVEVEKKIEFVRAKEEELKSQIAAKQQEKLRLSDAMKAGTGTMIEKLREHFLKSSEQTRQDLANTELEILRLEKRIEWLRAGKGLDPSADSRELIEKDPKVASLHERLTSETSRVIQRKAAMSPAALAQAEKELERLQAELDQARLKAAEALEKDRRALQDRLRDSQIASIEDELDLQKSIREKLVAAINEQEKADRERGQISIDIDAADVEITKLSKELAEHESARKRYEMERDQPGAGRVSKASAAEILPDGHADKRPKLIIAAVMGSLFFGIALAIVRGRLDARLHAPDDVASGTGLQILGAVPAINDLKRGRITEEEFAEAYRMLRVNILSRAWGNPPKSILITSAQAREGKTSLALSLSVSLAEMGKRVLLIDADLQAPKIGNLLNIDASSKLQYVLSGDRDLKSSAIASRLTNVDVLVGGAYTESRLVEQQSAERLIAEASARYDFVVLDSSPALGSADALVWSQVVDRVVVSTLLGSSDMRATTRVCQRLAMVGANVLGAVVCNVPVSSGYSSCPSSTYRTYSSSRSREATGDVYYLPMTGNQQQEEK